jgi:hypothetical protein
MSSKNKTQSSPSLEKNPENNEKNIEKNLKNGLSPSNNTPHVNPFALSTTPGSAARNSSNAPTGLDSVVVIRTNTGDIFSINLSKLLATNTEKYQFFLDSKPALMNDFKRVQHTVRYVPIKKLYSDDEGVYGAEIGEAQRGFLQDKFVNLGPKSNNLNLNSKNDLFLLKQKPIFSSHQFITPMIHPKYSTTAGYTYDPVSACVLIVCRGAIFCGYFSHQE